MTASIPQYVPEKQSSEKQCSRCHFWLPFDCFTPEKKGKFGLAARCNICKQELERVKRQESGTDQKQCTQCGRLLSFECFSPVKRGKFGLAARCKECKSEHERAVRADDRAEREAMRAALQQCTKCHRWLSHKDFTPDKASGSGRVAWCKTCVNSYQRSTIYTPERVRAKNLRKYGLTLEQYDRMLAEQGGVCAICKQPDFCRNPRSRKAEIQPLVVDHCHETGKVRALLCSSCNAAVGLMKEETERALSLVKYIEWCKTL